MLFLVAAFAAVEVLTLFAAFWFYRRQKASVPAKDYVELADAYLDALLEVVKSNLSRPFNDEIDPLS